MALKDEVQHLHCHIFFWQMDVLAGERSVLHPYVNELMLSSLLRLAVLAAVPQKQMMKKRMGKAVVNHQGLKRRKCL